MVYVPPGAYTSGTLHLRSHIRLFVEAGATIYSSKNPEAYSERALFYGEDLEHLGLGSGCTVTVDAGPADNSALRDLTWIDAYVAAVNNYNRAQFRLLRAMGQPPSAADL